MIIKEGARSSMKTTVEKSKELITISLRDIECNDISFTENEVIFSLSGSCYCIFVGDIDGASETLRKDMWQRAYFTIKSIRDVCYKGIPYPEDLLHWALVKEDTDTEKIIEEMERSISKLKQAI